MKRLVASAVGRALLGVALVAAGIALAFLTERADWLAFAFVLFGGVLVTPSAVAEMVKQAVALLRAKPDA